MECWCVLEVKLEACGNEFQVGGIRKRSVKDDPVFVTYAPSSAAAIVWDKEGGGGARGRGVFTFRRVN